MLNKQPSIYKILMALKSAKISRIPDHYLDKITSIIQQKTQSRYLFEIVGLYRHFALKNDRNGFMKIDSLLFPSRGLSQSSIIKYTNLAFTSLRLHCLLKYQQPYDIWLQQTRQQLHHSVLNSTIFRSMMTIAFFNFLKLDKKLIQFYSQFLQYLGQDITKIDVVSLLIIRQHYSREKIQTKQSEQVKNAIEQNISSNIKQFTFKKYHLLIKSNVLNRNWFFLYTLKTQIYAVKQFGFFFDILNRLTPWAIWALNTFGRAGVIQRIPYYGKPNPRLLILHYQSQIGTGRPYCDEFFQFQRFKDVKTGKERWRLKQYVQNLHLFIQNAYHTTINGGVIVEKQHLIKILEVLQDINQAKFPSRADMFVYLALHSLIIYYLNHNNQALKTEQQLKILQNGLYLINNQDSIRQQLAIKFKKHKPKQIIVTRIMKVLANMQKQTLQHQNFAIIFNLLTSNPLDLDNLMKFNSLSGQMNQLTTVINNYIKDDKVKQPLILFGQYKKYTPLFAKNITDLGGNQIFIAKKIEFDRVLTIDSLVKIKNIHTGKQIKILVDLAVRPNCDQQKQLPVSVRQAWKKKYISEWHGKIYDLASQNTIEEYIEKRKYEKYLIE